MQATPKRLSLPTLALLWLGCTAVAGGAIYADGDAGNGWVVHGISPGDENENLLYTYVADLNGDACLDVMADSYNSNHFRWYESDCNCSPDFTMHEISDNAGGIVDAVDLNNDGLTDIISMGSWHENDGNYPPNFTQHILPVDSSILGTVDLNNDGNIDLISMGEWYENVGNNYPTFEKHDVFSIDYYSYYFSDLDNDGDTDIITVDGWYENDGTTSPEFIKHDISIGYRVRIADLDNDGDMDIISYPLKWLENNGNLTFTEWVIADYSSDYRHTELEIEDLNNDGYMDIVILSGGSLFWHENSGDLTPTFTEYLITESCDPMVGWGWILNGGDLDRDGDVDLLCGGLTNIYWIENSGFAPVLHFVDDDAPNDPGPGDPQVSDLLEDGTQAHPFDAIQEAIDTAGYQDTILVADGTYTGEGNRDIDFLGKATTLRSENGPENCIIDCNGTEGEPHRGFYFDSGEDANSVLSGFTIINGHARYGGAVYCKDSSPTLMDCIFVGNSAGARGGGMYNRHSDPKLTNCTFIGNSTNYGGGGLYNYRGDPTLTDCTFSGNSANFGGGVGNYSNGSTITNCMFINNTADDGGGIWNDAGSPEITNCIFYRNSVTGCGGGLFDEDYGHAILTNCIFIENFAGGKGGAIRIYDSRPILTNCTISGNFAGGKGGGIFNDYSIAAVTSSILWGNEDEGGMDESAQIHISGGVPIVNYTCIQGLSGNLGGIGNIDADPCFVSPGYWDDWHPPYGISGWIDSDYHLKSQAGRSDPNSETWVQDDVTSPCIDAGDPMSPIGHEPFPNGGIVNMGAYGGTAEASKSYFGRPPCETIVAGDINGDCVVNFLDFRLMALHWMMDYDVSAE